MGRILHSREELTQAAEAERRSGHKIVSTNGCFDILHVGHARVLKQARELGDCLFVGLNSDGSVQKLKGPERPINSEADRAELLASLKAVDYVFVFSEDTPVEFLKMLKPDIHTKGADYTSAQLAETPVVESFGGQVKLLALVHQKSTTSLVEKIKADSK
jgi:rfaE bifunctional protein nucleotidyltransferase chain/domain